MRKTFILDTNVLIHDVDCFVQFKDNLVLIPIAVIEELDRFKSLGDERGKSARIASRRLDELRQKGRLDKGVPLENGGTLRVDMDHPSTMPKGTMIGDNDARILNTAIYLHKHGHSRVVLVTKDTNMRLRSEALGVEAQDYTTDKVDLSELYTGARNEEAEESRIDEFYKSKRLALDEKEGYLANEFVILRDKAGSKQSAIGKVRANGAAPELVPLQHTEATPWSIKPLNKEQRFAIELLLSEDIQLVTMIGIAGTGKTLLSIACGLQRTVDEGRYRRLIVCRPIIPVGRDLGYMPGTKEEKLEVWMGAIYDNLEFLMDRRHPEDGASQFDYLLQSGKVEIASVTHIRGRTLPRQYMIVDDAQNLTPHEIKTILSRAGEGTKVVVTGDPYQIDNPYLDVGSNGLTYIVERFQGQKLYGHVTFSKSERSELAGLVSELL